MEEIKGKYLTLYLKGEEYAINIKQIIEIIGLQPITEIPRSIKAVKGVINLRGKIIPIMDLRLKFDMEEKEYDERTCVVVVELEYSGETKQVGLIVDTVNEVVDIDNIDQPPSCGEDEREKFLLGIGKIKDRVVMLLDINETISFGDLETKAKIPEANEA